MTWTNAFDIGTCTVKVASAIDPTSPLFSQVMVKGDTRSFAGPGSESFTVSVSSLGVVTLANANTGIGIEADVLAIVVPSYSLADAAGAQTLATLSCVGTGLAGASADLGITTDFDSTSGPVDVDLTNDTPYAQLFVETSMINGSTLTPIIQFTPQFDVTAPPPPPPSCNELGRVTRSFVSGYTASRRETRRIRRYSKRCVVADFNGQMELGRTITHVKWECTSPWSTLMSNARIESTGRKVAVDVAFNFAGWGGILATATWDNGEITPQEFGFTVLDQPLYPSATYDTANGPYILTASL